MLESGTIGGAGHDLGRVVAELDGAFP